VEGGAASLQAAPPSTSSACGIISVLAESFQCLQNHSDSAVLAESFQAGGVRKDHKSCVTRRDRVS
jgi:hypothetical protein